MTRRQAQLARESAARIATHAAELMVAFPEAPVNLCLLWSVWEEEFIYGSSAIEHPIGLLGWNPLEDLGGKR